MHDSVTIMDITFRNTTQQAFVNDYVEPRLLAEQPYYIVTANPEIVMKTRSDSRYKQSVQQADVIVPDGAGILLAAKIMKQPLEERVAGFDVMLDLLAFADQHGLSCYFLGAEEAVNERAVAEVKRRFPNVAIAGRQHGFFQLDDPEVAENAAAAQADLIFVALGLPRQELWIAEHRDKFTKGVFMGVGGSFDVLAGTAKRAPDIWIKLNLEWLYRLLKQPLRFKRILKVFEFLLRVVFRKT
ncbi:WecB/TagA/CpsF family glycosyltransferase [Barrientosiimonas marina]|uniref:N-acetylglucosaminyldiphosphoundecaprenol N-acetyl-beta-D-mannosaminyltransferase n=1 Tax=Lentibacillus kimchii TaxID=1542911 RepID=A0ABW2UWL4_9BACI